MVRASLCFVSKYKIQGLEMKSKKSSLDKKNISKVFSSELCRVLTVISIASLILFSLASNVYALSWNDKQWGGAGALILV